MAHPFSLQFSHSVIISLPQKVLDPRSKSTRLISTVRCSNIKKINGADDCNHYRLNTYYKGATSNYQWDLTKSWDASAAGGLVKTLKENGNEYTWGGVTVKLAETYRFCCGDEPTVWEAIKNHKKRDYTSIIHGDASHEETTAAASIAGKYTIVNNLREAMNVCDYILGDKLYGSSSTKEEFLKHFRFQVSDGFDPDFDLIKVGIAGQPTMYRGETEEIGAMFMKAMMYKYGMENLEEHFFDATKNLLVATCKLVEKKLDFILVIGKIDSNSTSYVQETAKLNGIPCYWIKDEQEIGSGNKIRYKNGGELVEKEKCIPAGPITVGVIPGATTAKTVESVLMKVFEINHKETMWFE
ncbi:hypothetical protein MRB53_007472 [Persea americana]|uniref:Uncharacterized protein n=1 Tax=Persea americana TaxID=3435 RepID=A0ACC2MJA8_PERAE|nr:hypothetical protein MRB53_007472 [Persea americana]